MEQFKELDSPKNKELRQKLSREFLNCGLKGMVTDELVSHFTWHKGTKTEQLSDARVLYTLYQAAINIKIFEGPQNKNDFKAEVLQVLRATKQRFRNSRKKSLAKVIDETEEGEEIEESIQKIIFELEEMMSGSDADDEDEEFENNSETDE